MRTALAQTHHAQEIIVVDDGSVRRAREDGWRPSSASGDHPANRAPGRLRGPESRDGGGPRRLHRAARFRRRVAARRSSTPRCDSWRRDPTSAWWSPTSCRSTASGEAYGLLRRREAIPEDGDVLKYVLRQPALAPSSALFRRRVLDDVGPLRHQPADGGGPRLPPSGGGCAGRSASFAEPLTRAMRGHDGLSSLPRTYADYLGVMERFMAAHPEIPEQDRRAASAGRDSAQPAGTAGLGPSRSGDRGRRAGRPKSAVALRRARSRPDRTARRQGRGPAGAALNGQSGPGQASSSTSNRCQRLASRTSGPLPARRSAVDHDSAIALAKGEPVLDQEPFDLRCAEEPHRQARRPGSIGQRDQGVDELPEVVVMAEQVTHMGRTGRRVELQDGIGAQRSVARSLQRDELRVLATRETASAETPRSGPRPRRIHLERRATGRPNGRRAPAYDSTR